MPHDSASHDIVRTDATQLTEVAQQRETFFAVQQRAAEMVQVAKRDLVQAVWDTAAQTPEGAKAEVVNDLYWQCLEVDSYVLADAFGYKRGVLAHKIIKPYYSDDMACPTCQMPLKITSRSNLAETKRKLRGESPNVIGLYPADCEACRNVKLGDWHGSWSEEEAARERRRIELRDMPYREYLQSPEWQAKRRKHLKYAGFRCQLCNQAETILDVHHRTYARRGNEAFKDLVVLCRDCHTRAHDRAVS